MNAVLYLLFIFSAATFIVAFIIGIVKLSIWCEEQGWAWLLVGVVVLLCLIYAIWYLSSPKGWETFTKTESKVICVQPAQQAPQ